MQHCCRIIHGFQEVYNLFSVLKDFSKNVFAILQSVKAQEDGKHTKPTTQQRTEQTPAQQVTYLLSTLDLHVWFSPYVPIFSSCFSWVYALILNVTTQQNIVVF